MKILNYKSLNEQSVFDQARSASKATGISQGSMRTLVGANLKRDTRIGKIPTVNAFRNLGFSFVTQQSYNDFLTSNNASVLEVFNQLNYTFAMLYEGDSCYIYPYRRQSLTLDSIDYIKSYIKLDLFRRDNSTTQENVQQYFAQFNPNRSDENEFNVKNYKLTILGNFDDINKKYSVPAELINLRTFETPPELMFISLNAVSKEYVINTAYGQNENKYFTLGIDFSPKQIQGLQGVSGATNAQAEPYLSFNNTFNSIIDLVLSKQQKTSMLATNQNINLPQNLATQFPFMTIFKLKNGNKLFHIYTKKIIKDLLVVNQQRIECVIGRNFNEFYAAEMVVNDVN
jgi:hypothetical protein